MNPSTLTVGFVAVSAALFSGGCSLTVFDRVECSSNTQCRSEFALGSVCGDAGFCESIQTPARCTRSFPEDFFRRPQDYADHILLGSLFSYENHHHLRQAAELAVRQVNQSSGLEGLRYAILHCDYESMAGDGLDDIGAVELLAPFLANDFGVPAIIGPHGSSRTEATFNAVRDDSVVVISPAATSPALTDLDGSGPTDADPGFLWRTSPPDSLQSKIIAKDMGARGVTQAAVIFQQGSYGDGLASLFVQEFTGMGQAVSQYPFEAGTDFSATVAVVGEAIDQGVEEVLFVSSDIDDYIKFFLAATATVNLERQYTEGLGSTLPEGGLFLPDAAYTEILLLETANTPASALYAKVRGSRPAPADGVLFDSFAASYIATFNEDSTSSGFAPHAYDAAWMAIYGTAWSTFNRGEISGLGIAQGLRKLSSGPHIDILPSNWNTIVDSFRTGQSVNIDGASGSLDFDPTTEETSAPIEMWRIVARAEDPIGYGFERIEGQ